MVADRGYTELRRIYLLGTWVNKLESISCSVGKWSVSMKQELPQRRSWWQEFSGIGG